jgi:hypothetical protein
MSLDKHQNTMATLLRDNSTRYRLHEVFRDFCEMAAISLSNAMDYGHRDVREARYMELVGRYERSEIARFPQILGELVESLEGRFHDALGELFMALDLGGHWHGQFFTPYEIAGLMARLTVGDVADHVRRHGYITLNEPACGAGAMIIAAADAIQEQGVNYQTAMHVVAQDIDPTAVHMTYIQLALYHIPAIVVHGNSLAATSWDHWVTPAHVLGMWDRRLAHAEACADMHDILSAPTVEPVPDMEEIRVEIVRKRFERAEQMSLFG